LPIAAIALFASMVATYRLWPPEHTSARIEQRIALPTIS
jgi:hypothetical protein